MGLLNRVGRFAGGMANAMGDRLGEESRRTGMAFMPVTSSLTGAAVGGALGGAYDQSTGGSGAGALAGAGIGAGAMGARSLARLLGTGVMGGVRAMREPQEIASQLVRIAQSEGPESAQAQLRQLSQMEPELADEVTRLLTSGHNRFQPGS